MAFIFKITAALSQDRLARFGPLIPGRVALPTAQNPSGAIEGYFLIDTGASNCSIDQSVADELGLQSARTITSHGLGGAVDHKTYDAMFFIPATPLRGQFPPGSTMMLGFKQEVGSVSLNRYHRELEEVPGRLLGIIGRNILQFTRTTYDGLTGTITIEADETLQQPKGR
jgi:hypothetical protein